MGLAWTRTRLTSWICYWRNEKQTLTIEYMERRSSSYRTGYNMVVRNKVTRYTDNVAMNNFQLRGRKYNTDNS